MTWMPEPPTAKELLLEGIKNHRKRKTKIHTTVMGKGKVRKALERKPRKGEPWDTTPR